MHVSVKPKILVSLFPSGRAVATILKDGKTVWRTFPTDFEHEEILKAVSECETEIEVKERVWNEKIFQVSDFPLISLEPGPAIGPQIIRQSKPERRSLLSAFMRFVRRG